MGITHPMIQPGKPETYNRKYRRALKAIAGTQLTSKQRMARIDDLLRKTSRYSVAGRYSKPREGHDELVLQFLAAL